MDGMGDAMGWLVLMKELRKILEDLRLEHVLMEVCLEDSFSFLFMGDGCRFQPLILPGCSWKNF